MPVLLMLLPAVLLLLAVLAALAVALLILTWASIVPLLAVVMVSLQRQQL